MTLVLRAASTCCVRKGHAHVFSLSAGITASQVRIAKQPRGGVAEHLHNFSHHLMAHDVARKHRRDVVVKQVQVRTADRAARYLDYSIANILDLRISDNVSSDVFLAVPNERSHRVLHSCSGPT